jgi:hypothetical protein
VSVVKVTNEMIERALSACESSRYDPDATRSKYMRIALESALADVPEPVRGARLTAIHLDEARAIDAESRIAELEAQLSDANKRVAELEMREMIGEGERGELEDMRAYIEAHDEALDVKVRTDWHVRELEAKLTAVREWADSQGAPSGHGCCPSMTELLELVAE